MAKVSIDREANQFIVEPENSKELLDIAVVMLAIQRLNPTQLSLLVEAIEDEFGVLGTDAEIEEYGT